MDRRRKRTDVRDSERAMARDLPGIVARQLGHQVDAILRQGYLDDPESGAYSLPGLVMDLPVDLMEL